MSDLCYNCGRCHLPRTCDKALVDCDLCGHQGHTINFCPRGLITRDSTYGFFMLCHNCDKWHLPYPCEYALGTCTVCGNGGHYEHYCPVAAVTRRKARDLGLDNGEERIGIKRQRTSDSSFDSIVALGGEPGEATSEAIKSLKEKIARDTLKMLDAGVPRELIPQYVRDDKPAIIDETSLREVCKALGTPFKGARPQSAGTLMPSSFPALNLQHPTFANGQSITTTSSAQTATHMQSATHQSDPFDLPHSAASANDQHNSIALSRHLSNLTPRTSIGDSSASAFSNSDQGYSSISLLENESRSFLHHKLAHSSSPTPGEKSPAVQPPSGISSGSAAEVTGAAESGDLSPVDSVGEEYWGYY